MDWLREHQNTVAYISAGVAAVLLLNSPVVPRNTRVLVLIALIGQCVWIGLGGDRRTVAAVSIAVLSFFSTNYTLAERSVFPSASLQNPRVQWHSFAAIAIQLASSTLLLTDGFSQWAPGDALDGLEPTAKAALALSPVLAAASTFLVLRCSRGTVAAHAAAQIVASVAVGVALFTTAFGGERAKVAALALLACPVMLVAFLWRMRAHACRFACGDCRRIRLEHAAGKKTVTVHDLELTALGRAPKKGERVFVVVKNDDAFAGGDIVYTGKAAGQADSDGGDFAVLNWGRLYSAPVSALFGSAKPKPKLSKKRRTDAVDELQFVKSELDIDPTLRFIAV